ncbi:replication protein [Pseudomonas fluorescens]|uniref:replication protein n=1 Tax=Pseudomonas fluorescens TaxID=294 RepID=UPI003D1C6204
MTNIFQIDKSRGFTRMDNSLMDALMAIDLPGRELKVALFIAKATINFQADSVRIKATEVSKSTNLHPDVASRAISHLLKRRVIAREGGARGEISICDPKEWIYFECPIRTKQSESDHMVRVVDIASRTKTGDSLLYTKKETLLPLSTKESNPTLENPERVSRKSKAATASVFGKVQMLADNPHGVSEQSVDDYLKLRKAKRAPVTARVWANVNAALTKCAAVGIKADEAVGLAVLNGWQGFEPDWIIGRLSKNQGSQRFAPSAPDFFSTDWRTDTSSDL